MANEPPGCSQTASLLLHDPCDLWCAQARTRAVKIVVLPGYSLVDKAPLVSHVKVTALRCFCVKDQPWFGGDLPANGLNSSIPVRTSVFK